MKVITIVVGALGTAPKCMKKGEKRTEDNKKNQDDSDYCIVQITRIKSSRDLRRLAVTHIPVKYHQLTMVRKTCKQ